VNVERGPCLEAVIQRVAERHGLDFSGFRLPNLVDAIAQVVGAGDDGCRKLLGLGDTELDRVAEAASNGETYFLRHPEQFEALTNEIIPRLMRVRRETKTLRVWSAGCSSGEEPLSLAMVALESVPSDWTVDILATDLSSEALKRAGRASYSEWSFRSVPPEVRARYFAPAAGRFTPSQRLRALVRHARHNLLDPPPGIFDLVVCRNVLIYFGPAALSRAAANLSNALAPDGMLLLGPAEAIAELYPGLAVERFNDTPFFKRRHEGLGDALPIPGRSRPSAPDRPRASAPRASSPRVSAPRLSPRRASAPRSSAPRPSAPRPLPPAPGKVRPLAEQVEILLKRVHRLADRGDLGGAWRLLDVLVQRAPLVPEVHLTRAIVARERRTPAEAARSAEAALYLKPDLALAHVLLGDLHRGQGDTRSAALAYRNALGALAGRPDDELVSGGNGISAAELAVLARRAVDALTRGGQR